jgi:hypothetical protein
VTRELQARAVTNGSKKNPASDAKIARAILFVRLKQELSFVEIMKIGMGVAWGVGCTDGIKWISYVGVGKK